ncbi:PAS domain-containing protein [Sphingomonas sinipercae]|uniref:histidine kinase n=1 Tax=Sphingomonas sinipercae TaxID=2714944 RepID=A0A6G7ZQY9_9SPHN|nr:PAS domain-containing protein [Sphingomonas sinipercae]
MGTSGVFALAFAGLWIIIAALLSALASRRIRDATGVIDAAQRMRGLLELSPARPVIVHPDLAIEADARLSRELGLLDNPQTLGDLSGPGAGLLQEDVDALAAAVRAATVSGGRVELQVRLAGSERVLEVRGGAALTLEAPGSLILWFSDTTTAESERLELAHRLRQTEAALDALTHVIEAAPFPMWYRGPDLKLGLVNRAFVDAVEAREATEVIANGLELVSDRESAKAGALAAIDSGKPSVRKQAAIVRGERRMLRLVNVPLPTGAVAGFAIDVQDLEDARDELVRHAQSQRELADRMTAGVAQFDHDRTLSFFNQPFASMAHIDPEWLGERPEFDRVLERMREMNRVPETRDFPSWKADRRNWFTSADEVIEEDWILANGDHFRVVGQPLPDGGLRLFLEDRTEQVRLASARDTLLRVRAATFDNLFEAIGVFASDGRLYLWNRRFSQVWDLDEEWLGEHPRVDELVPAIARKLVNPTAAAQIREMVRKTTNERQPANGRLTLTDGRHFDFAAVPLPDGNALFTLVDVTDSSRIEAALRERATALEQASRVKTDFVANMSYELRTPLTSIGGFAEMLSQGYAGDLSSSAKDYVQAILESVTRLSKLIDDVLDLTQGDARGVVLERERVDIAGLCKAAFDKVSARAEKKEQKLTPDIQGSAGFVVGDARRIRESVEHLLSNALAYTDTGGSIALKTWGDEAAAHIQVSDNGAGIAKKDLPRVFNRFDRVSDDGVRGEAALGLGLPLARQFIEAHGGKVDLVSAKGKGTTVTLTLPRAPE